MQHTTSTYSFLYSAELLELLTKSILISVPCEAAVHRHQQSIEQGDRVRKRAEVNLPNEEF